MKLEVVVCNVPIKSVNLFCAVRVCGLPRAVSAA